MYLKEVAKTHEEINRIKELTRLQGLCDLWYLERRKRNTASNFGSVCKRRLGTGCDVNRISHRICIKVSTVKLMRLLHYTLWKTQSTRKYVLVEYLYLGKHLPHLFSRKSRRTCCDEHGLVEIKCPWSARNMTPEEGVLIKKITFWLNGSVNKKHNWYYQIQVQLRIAEKQYGILEV